MSRGMTPTEAAFLKPTLRETCSCGAVFETDTFSLAAREKEIAAFREAHKVCRERRVEQP